MNLNDLDEEHSLKKAIFMLIRFLFKQLKIAIFYAFALKHY